MAVCCRKPQVQVMKFVLHLVSTTLYTFKFPFIKVAHYYAVFGIWRMNSEDWFWYYMECYELE